MILVDTSIRIDYLRFNDRRLAELLNRSQILAHPCVTGELACRNLHNRDEFLRLLNALPQSPVASPAEVLYFIDRHQLMGLGVGYIEIHLLAATVLAEKARLWTGDKLLQQVVSRMSLSFDDPMPKSLRITPGWSVIHVCAAPVLSPCARLHEFRRS